MKDKFKIYCPKCGRAIPTDDAYDYIPAEDVHFCYYCGSKIEQKENDKLDSILPDEEIRYMLNMG